MVLDGTSQDVVGSVEWRLHQAASQDVLAQIEWRGADGLSQDVLAQIEWRAADGVSSDVLAQVEWRQPDGASQDLFAQVEWRPSVAATTIEIVSGDNQTGIVGTQLANPLVILARDSNGDPMRDVSFDFTALIGAGTLNPSSAATGPDGTVSFNWTLGPEAGSQAVRATTEGPLTLDFVATAEPTPSGGGVLGSISAPATAPTATVLTNPGLVYNGQYYYAYTFVTAQGETPPSPLSNLAVTGFGMQQVQVDDIAAGPSGVLSRKLYRTTSGTFTLQFLAEIPDNTTTSYLDVLPDTALGPPAPEDNTTGGTSLGLQITTLNLEISDPVTGVQHNLIRTPTINMLVKGTAPTADKADPISADQYFAYYSGSGGNPVQSLLISIHSEEVTDIDLLEGTSIGAGPITIPHGLDETPMLIFCGVKTAAGIAGNPITADETNVYITATGPGEDYSILVVAPHSIWGIGQWTVARNGEPKPGGGTYPQIPAATTNYAIPHGLIRTPDYVLLGARTSSGVSVGQAPDATNIYLTNAGGAPADFEALVIAVHSVIR